MPCYQIKPDDLLMFRDGRPIEPLSGSGAHGGHWPEPSILFDALHAALQLAFPTPQDWEHPHRFGRSGDRDASRPRTQRFGSLVTAGPFPILEGKWLFPVPQDVARPDEFAPSMLPITSAVGDHDLPQLLRWPLGNRVQTTKEGPLPWWDKAAFEQYLHWPLLSDSKGTAFAEEDIFLREWTIGIGVDSATETAGRGEARSQIYSAEYLRLQASVSMGIHAQMPTKNSHSPGTIDGLPKLFPQPGRITVGGQQRACQVEPMPEMALRSLLPSSAQITGTKLKWVLLSPAVFPQIHPNPDKQISAHHGGWLPNWIAPHDQFRVWQGTKASRFPPAPCCSNAPSAVATAHETSGAAPSARNLS